jgi:CRP/FNR family cyclic AMP-dependent transcriptional regulator
MPIRLKIARTAKELDDVFRLRYNVYVLERHKFAESPEETERRIIDRFDAVPDVANIVAYDGDVPIAAMRINKDSKIGLPAEQYYDFSDVRTALEKKSRRDGNTEPALVSGSMLAVHEDWRNRRNVIFALFKTAAGVMHSWGATHVIGSISEETLSLYGRIGFSSVAEPRWIKSIGDHLIPILAPFDKVFEWAFAGITKTLSPFWIDNISGQFERVLLSPGEVLFRQGDSAQSAYIVDEGWISIARKDQEGHEIVLANLSEGALFGELALLDNEPRNATAVAVTNSELIVIERDCLSTMIKQNPDRLTELLQQFANRLRETADLAMIMRFAPQTGRVLFTLNQLWNSATPDRKDPSVKVAKISIDQLAKSAQVREHEVRRILEIEKVKGNLDYGMRSIRFLRQPPKTGEIKPLEKEDIS